MADLIKTMEIISSTKKIGDLWDSFDREESPSQLMLKLPAAPCKMRFLGPFVMTKRLYLPPTFRKNTSTKEIVAILNNNQEVIEKVRTRINDIVQNNRKSHNRVGAKQQEDITNFLNKPPYWQTCLLVNALIKYSEVHYNIRIATLTKNICDKFASYRGSLKINGLKARDITITKQYPNQSANRSAYSGGSAYSGAEWGGDNALHELNSLNRAIGTVNATTLSSTYITYNTGVFTANPPALDQPKENSIPNYKVDIHEESLLTQPQIDYILRQGLIDIREVIHELNGMRNYSYVFKEVSNYRMPNEFIGALTEELGKIEEEKHIEKVEEEILELPRDAFENANTMREPIASLEVD